MALPLVCLKDADVGIVFIELGLLLKQEELLIHFVMQMIVADAFTSANVNDPSGTFPKISQPVNVCRPILLNLCVTRSNEYSICTEMKAYLSIFLIHMHLSTCAFIYLSAR